MRSAAAPASAPRGLAPAARVGGAALRPLAPLGPLARGRLARSSSSGSGTRPILLRPLFAAPHGRDADAAGSDAPAPNAPAAWHWAARLPAAALAGGALALAAAQGARAAGLLPRVHAATAAEAAIAPAQQQQRQHKAGPAAAAASDAAASKTATPVASASMAVPGTIPSSAVMKYKILQVFAMPTIGKLAVVLAVAVPVILAGGYAYKRAMQVPWSQALTNAYHVMSNCPGVDITSAESRAAAVINNTVYFAGLLGFAVVLGVICDDIGTAVSEVRSGNFAVAERNHTVVLGWNRTTLPTLRQIAIAQAQAGDAKPFGMPVVVLAERNKAELDAEIANELDGALPVVTRCGSAARLDDLRRVSAATAGTVLVQYPDEKDKDAASAEQAATLAALKREGGPEGQRVVVQGDGEGADDLDAAAVALQALRGGGGVGPGAAEAELVVTNGERRISQLMAQVALQPGLEYVLGDLLEFEDDYRGAEFYMAPLDEDLAGRPYRDVRRAFSRGVLIGFVAPGPAARLSLNPRDADPVPRNARLVFVASDQRVERSEVAPGTSKVDMPKLRRCRGGQLRKKSIVVLSFDRDSACLLQALRDFCPRGSSVTFVTSDPNARELVKSVQRRGVKITAIVGNPASGATLREARLERADSVIVHDLAGSEAANDARVVATVLQLQALSARHLESGKRAASLDVVAAVNSTSTEEVLWHATLSHEAEAAAAAVASSGQPAPAGRRAAADLPAALQLHMLNPDQLRSGMVTQAAIEPRLNRVFAELFTNEVGHEIYLKRASAFGLPAACKPARMSWAQVQEAVRARGQTALGVAPAQGGPDAIVMAPAASDDFVLTEQDEIIVISQS